jgi:hypothetical protein
LPWVMEVYCEYKAERKARCAECSARVHAGGSAVRGAPPGLDAPPKSAGGASARRAPST